MSTRQITLACLLFIFCILSTGIAFADVKPETDALNFGFIDGHCDTITTVMDKGENLYKNNLHLDFSRLLEYGAPVQVFTVWCDDSHVKSAFEYADSAIDFFLSELEANSDIVELALSAEDIVKNAQNNKISAILALEGGEPLSGKIENLDYFYEKGVRLITLTWNRENELGYGIGTGSLKGLKPFGIKCVKRMNELGIIIDVSHLNEAGFWDVHTLSEKPYIASHSNAYSITANKRNLKDPQILAIAEKGGIIGLNLYPYFLSNSKNADLDNALNHIKHFKKLDVLDNIGLGCDFDGVEILPKGVNSVSSLKSLEQEFNKEFGEDTASALMYGNYYEFFTRFFTQQ